MIIEIIGLFYLLIYFGCCLFAGAFLFEEPALAFFSVVCGVFCFSAAGGMGAFDLIQRTYSAFAGSA